MRVTSGELKFTWNSSVSQVSAFKRVAPGMITTESPRCFGLRFVVHLYLHSSVHTRIDPDGQTCCYCCHSDWILRLRRPSRLIQVPFLPIHSSSLKWTDYSFQNRFHIVIFSAAVVSQGWKVAATKKVKSVLLWNQNHIYFAKYVHTYKEVDSVFWNLTCKHIQNDNNNWAMVHYTQ